ncbi:MAG: glycosyltransferase family 2 protein [Lachnospiraceae bacterium]|nr:glycosyltransferase family 2 protein [Lachnospiraceae bacterium]
MSEKLISIIVPCYNVEKYIDRCFDSIYNQTIGIDNLEVIMIDDASTDGTWNKLVGIEEKCPESVMIIHCDENGRQGTARNLGLEYASAEYITYIDSDDWIEKEMLEDLYLKIKDSSCDIVSCGFWRDKGTPEQKLPPATDEVGDKHFVLDTIEKSGMFLMCMSMGLTAWGKLYRKNFLIDNELYFLEKCPYEDRFFVLLMYLYVKDVLVIDRRYYHYFVNNESTVLKKDADYHYEIINVDDRTWMECDRRGLLDSRRKQIECYFLLIGYLSPLKLISYRFDNPPYDFFLKLQNSIRTKIPDYKSNPYIKDFATEFNYGVLETLYLNLNEAEFESLCKLIKKRYGEV